MVALGGHLGGPERPLVASLVCMDPPYTPVVGEASLAWMVSFSPAWTFSLSPAFLASSPGPKISVTAPLPFSMQTSERKPWALASPPDALAGTALRRCSV